MPWPGDFTYVVVVVVSLRQADGLTVHCPLPLPVLPQPVFAIVNSAKQTLVQDLCGSFPTTKIFPTEPLSVLFGRKSLALLCSYSIIKFA